MEKTKGTKIKLGVFVSAGFVLLIAAIYLIGERQQLFNKTFHLNAVFEDISGLQVGNNVRFSGINVGVVDGIEQITDSTVRVDMRIANDTKRFIKKNARAIIGSDGLMGNKILVITPGAASAQEINDNDRIESSRSVSMDEIFADLKVTSENAAVITDDLSAIIKNLRNGNGAIGKLFMDSVFADNIGDAIVNIKQGTGGFKQNMDAASNNFLLRGYFKKKKQNEQEAAERKAEAKEKKNEAQEEKKEDRKDKKAERKADRAEKKAAKEIEKSN